MSETGLQLFSQCTRGRAVRPIIWHMASRLWLPICTSPRELWQENLPEPILNARAKRFPEKWPQWDTFMVNCHSTCFNPGICVLLKHVLTPLSAIGWNFATRMVSIYEMDNPTWDEVIKADFDVLGRWFIQIRFQGIWCAVGPCIAGSAGAWYIVRFLRPWILIVDRPINVIG